MRLNIHLSIQTCIQNKLANGDFKKLTIGTASDKLFRVKHLIFLKSQNMTYISLDLFQ